MAPPGSFYTKLMMSINQDPGRSYVPRGAKTIKRALCRLRQGSKLRAKHGPAQTVAIPHVPEYGEIYIDSATSGTVTNPSCFELTPSPDSGGLRTDPPASCSVVSDNANSQAETPKLMRKKGKTFPISKSDSKAQGLGDEMVNNKRGAGVMESKLNEVGQRETQTSSQRQPVPEDFKHTSEVDKQKLRQGILPNLTKLLLHPQPERAHGKPAEDSNQFVKIWELDLLPKLEEILDGNVNGEYSINVRRGEEAGYRIIEIMTAEGVSEKVQSLLEDSKRESLRGDLGLRTSMRIRLGSIEFLSDAPSRSSTKSEEYWYPPINTRRYTNPVMGDSIGPPWPNSSATMGPLLEIAHKFYRILNWHVFDDKDANRYCEDPNPPALDAFHPSLDDSKGHSISLGKTFAYSGRMYKTSRVSKSIQRAFGVVLGDNAKPAQAETVTDWVLVETATGRQVNKVRHIDMPTSERCDSFSTEITRVSDPKIRSSGNMPQFVYSTGRSSGHSRGQICEVPGRHTLPNGIKTRNWFIECSHSPDEDWNRGGMGMPGDSGAPVIDQETHSLLGQIWGRDKYKTDVQDTPITYFTAMSDIYDDIRERVPNLGSPRLPTNASLAGEVSRPRSPVPNPAIIGGDDRRPTLASISEDGGEQPMALPGSLDQRRSVARVTARTSTRLSGYGNFPGLEPARRWTTIIHAATL
ncbi:hypothetical protein F5Y06DRAFT_49370 [Hypoxylon sp. FL0890]|nr:hypothetical protein F5Y06DRAFT_49370 [Hypoxylon sp. FL0890]